MPPLRIGIDGRAFTSPAAGVRRYARSLVEALAALGERLELVALGGVDEAIPPGLAHVGEAPHPPTNAGWSLVGLPRTAKRAGVDLIHAPSYTAPIWAPVPVVLTIHDVSYARRPRWYPHRRDRLRRAFYRWSARAAAHVITDSEFSASEITAAYEISPTRITVVPLGVSHAFAPADGVAPPALPRGVRPPFLLHVGDLHERRNLPMLLEAMLGARRRFGMAAALSLVLAGVDRGIGDALCERAKQEGVAGAVVRLGQVGDDLLLALYRAAAALVYPSRYEGFGLPLVEAMACGTPVVASRAASIPEVVGDAGILLDPDDERGWSEAIVRVVEDERLRADLRAAGLARAALFTWERTARMTAHVYRRVALDRLVTRERGRR